MTPIIPAGGKKMEWVKDPEATVTKTAQSLFDDDPQLDAIKELPGMQDGIAELQDMNNNVSTDTEVPSLDNFGGETSSVSTQLDSAIDKVKDAAEEVAEVAKQEIKQVVTKAVENAGVVPVVDKVVEEIEFEIPDESEKKEEHEKSETEEEEKKEEEEVKKDEIPGVEGNDEDDEGIEKKSKDTDEGEGEKTTFASGKGMRRLAELSPDEAKELRHYWKDLLGFPAEYVNAMIKTYRA